MPKPLTIPPLDEATLADLRARYDAANDADLRLRYQMILLAQQGRAVAEIAAITFRSRDTVERVLKRFRAGGLDAVPRRFAPGSTPTITPAWTAELLRVVDLDPHDVGVASANWTTGLLSTYLAEHTGIAVSDETVRSTLHAHDYVCKRPTWTLKRKAEEQPGYVGNA
jgi:transposase